MKIVRAPRSAVCKKLFCFALSSLSFVFCLSAQAQQPKMISLGFLGATSAAIEKDRIDVFMEGMRELGYVENKNIVIKWRFAEGKFTRLPELANELVRLKVDVIVTTGPTSTRAAKEATTVIPIVMGFDNDPVGSGFIASLARPGGNITGLSSLAPEISGKRLELLKEIVPKFSRVAVFGTSVNNAGNAQALKETELAAGALAIAVTYHDILSVKDIENAFGAANKIRADAVLLLGSPIYISHRKQVANLAVTSRLPATYNRPEYVHDGGLMSYGVNSTDLLRRAATYVDKILKGAKPADLPVEQPTKFQLVINLKAAKQIGLTIPPNVLARANRIIK